jgi:ribosomal-protein-alanine N-acetyltransferase
MSNADPEALYPFREIPPRTFDTARLHLRASGLSDLELVFKLYTNDPLATKYMSWPRSTTVEDGRVFLEIVEDSFAGISNGALEFVWLIQVKQTGEFIGSCGIGTQQGSTVGGGYILSPPFWHRGYAAEAWAPVVEWAKTQPDIHRIEAVHHPDNPASGAVMRKVGLTFDRIDHKRNGYPNLGEGSVDELVYAWVRT